MLTFLAPVAAGFYLPNLWLSLRSPKGRNTSPSAFPTRLTCSLSASRRAWALTRRSSASARRCAFPAGTSARNSAQLNLELRAGKSRRDALKDLASRTGLDELNALATLLVQSQKFGANVGQALRVHADSMRSKRSQRAEELAAKLPIKLLFPTVCFIFPSLFLVLMGPALIQAYRMWTVH